MYKLSAGAPLGPWSRPIDHGPALSFMKIKAPFTLEILCALCRGAVTLQMASKPLHAPADRQCWACPYCLKDNSGRFPYEVVWVEKRYPAES